MNEQQPQHKESLTPDGEKMRAECKHWLSEIQLWQVELNFFQKLLEEYAPKMNTAGERKAFAFLQTRNQAFEQSLIPPFRGEVKSHQARLQSCDARAQPGEKDEVLVSAHIAVAHEYSALRTDYLAYKTAFTQLIDQVKNFDAMSPGT